MVQQNGGGFTSYRWAKPGRPAPKLSYDLGYEPWDWTFMTGMYIDDLNDEFIRDMWEAIAMLAAICIALTVIVLFVIRSIEHSIGGAGGRIRRRIRIDAGASRRSVQTGQRVQAGCADERGRFDRNAAVVATGETCDRRAAQAQCAAVNGECRRVGAVLNRAATLFASGNIDA
jgi:signal transduction histidine kinase